MTPPLISSIRRINGYGNDAYTYYPVVIIGAGVSGIAMACRLKEELRFDQFAVFDRQSEIGGTWWIHQYPGIACDVPASLYSFSFAQNPDWTTLNPSGKEIFEYLARVCEKYGIVDKFQLNTEVLEMCWLEDEEEWQITLAHLIPGTGNLTASEREVKMNTEGEGAVFWAKETVRAKIVVSGAGKLVQPNPWPRDIPGIEAFEGNLIHTARWDHNAHLDGKDVIVIGTGCSAAQIVPQLVKSPTNAKSVTQVMRSPPWVLPDLLSREKLRVWDKYRRSKYEKKLLKYMQNTAPEEYHQMLTPNYEIGCKRRVLDVDWFQSLHHPDVNLITFPLKSVQEKTVTVETTDDTNQKASLQLPADAIILANGYQATAWLHPLSVKGRGGKDLRDLWDERGGAQAYLGIAVDKFPNFFLIFGPNSSSGHTSVIIGIENAVNYSLKFIKRILNGEISTYEVREEAVVAWTSKVQASLKNAVWGKGGCKTWYKSEDGWNATVYPFSQFYCWYCCAFPTWNDWVGKPTRHGAFMYRNGFFHRLLAIGAVLYIASLCGYNETWSGYYHKLAIHSSHFLSSLKEKNLPT